MKFNVGDIVQLTRRRQEDWVQHLEVYEATNSAGETYLALRDYPFRRLEYNGALSFYERGFWGGPPSLVRAATKEDA